MTKSAREMSKSRLTSSTTLLYPAISTGYSGVHRMITLLLATRNAHKVEEIRSILGTGYYYQTLDEYKHAPELIEDADSFAGNATRKAVQLAGWIARSQASAPGNSTAPKFVLADDSGLEVDALRGAPGVHSARFAALDAGLNKNSSSADNNAKLLRLLHGIPLPERSARFCCVIALTAVAELGLESASPVCYACEEEFGTELFEGTCEGHIGLAPSGSGGFGYDPLFVPTGYNQTFAELGEEIKNRLSHRGKALAGLKMRFKVLS